jgi:hypothetical protein
MVEFGTWGDQVDALSFRDKPERFPWNAKADFKFQAYWNPFDVSTKTVR